GKDSNLRSPRGDRFTVCCVWPLRYLPACLPPNLGSGSAPPTSTTLRPSKPPPATKPLRTPHDGWSWRRELNPRPADYKSAALPLSYASDKPRLYQSRRGLASQVPAAFSGLGRDQGPGASMPPPPPAAALGNAAFRASRRPRRPVRRRRWRQV